MISNDQFEQEIIRLSTQVAQPSVTKIKEFILKASGARLEDLDQAQTAWLEMCGFTLHLEGLMHLSDPEHKSKPALASFDFHRRTVYFSIHLVGACVIVRSASELERYTSFVEIPCEDFGYTPIDKNP